MPGPEGSNRTENCSIQEVIDSFNIKYNNILTKEQEISYTMKLIELIPDPVLLRERVESGQYSIKARKMPSCGRYYIDTEKNSELGINVTDNQLIEIKKFIAYLEEDKIKNIIYEERKADRKRGLIIIPIVIIIIYFATRSSIFWSTFLCGGLIIFYILMIIGMIKDKEFSKKK